MVTRLPGTFGSACEPIGSTVIEPADRGGTRFLRSSGAITAEIASIVDGKA